MQHKVFLDPLNDHITSSTFEKSCDDLAKKIAHYRKYPFEVKLLFAVCFAAPIFVFGIFVGLHYFNFTVMVASFIGLFLFHLYMNSLKKDVASLMLAEKKGWAYNPDPEYMRAGRLAHLFPDVFDRGDPDLRYVDNQVWGNFGGNEQYSFWSSIFHYEKKHTEYRRNAGYAKFFTKEKEYSDKSVFIMELQHTTTVSFSLFTHEAKQTADANSLEFNDRFRILLDDKGKHTRLNIASILTPSVIARLLDFANTYAVDCISLRHNCLVVLFDKPIWRPKHTSFVRKVDLDERDLRQYDKILHDISALSLEIVKILR